MNTIEYFELERIKMNMIICKRLKNAREASGLTQDEVAERLGIGRSTYTQIELGRNQLMIEHLVKLPGILGVSVSYILGMAETNLSSEEIELVTFFRKLPEGLPRKYVLKFVKSSAQEDWGD